MSIELKQMFEEEEKPIDPQQLPIYTKAIELLDIVFTLKELIPENDQDLQRTIGIMLEDVMVLAPKIARAEAAGLYDLKMENAALIRKSARDLRTFINRLELHGFDEKGYLSILRHEIDELRPMFAEWVKTFDQWDYVIDRWGLFNPPGVSYDDKDPDDDIPFNSNDMFI